jgi:hypothetical protein
MAAILAGALMVGTPVRAQTSGEEQQTAGWVFIPSIGFGGSWDDNVLLAHPDSDPPGDYATPLSPSVTLGYGGRRTRFSALYGGSVVTYRTLDALNRTEQRVHVSAMHRLSPRLTLFANESFIEAPTTDALALAGVPFYRIGSRSNAVGGGAEAMLTRHTKLRGSYTLNAVEFDTVDPAPANLQGGYAHTVIVALTRALSSRITAGAEYHIQRAVLSEGLDRFAIQTAAGTFEYRVSPTVIISGLAGIARLNDSVQHESRTGPALRVGVSRRFREAALSAGYHRTYIPSFGFGGTFSNEEWVGSAHMPFARNRAYLAGSISWSDNEPLDPADPSLKTLLFSGTLGYRATRWLSLEGFYGRTQQDTQRLDGAILTRNQVGFRIVATKPLKLH